MVETEIRRSARIGREGFWVVDILPCEDVSGFCRSYVTKDGTKGNYEDYPTIEEAAKASKLFLMSQPREKASAGENLIRKFDTGATRDTVEGKLSYVKALSPIALQRYVQYVAEHRKQADGSIRDFDNWKQGIPVDAYLDGLGRHFFAVWLLAQGFPAEDNHGPVTLEDTLCAIIFNASGWLHELLKKE